MFHIFANILILWDHFVETVKSFVPPFVMEVCVLTKDDFQIDTVYEASYPTCGLRWKSWISRDMMPTSEGSYFIKVWNGREVQTVLLRDEILAEVLNLKNISTMWSLSERGFISLLMDYMRPRTKSNVWSILLNGQDVTKVVKPIMSSICIPNNITANMLSMAYHMIFTKYDNSFEFSKKVEHSKVTIVDYDLEENITNDHEFIR